MNNYMIDVETLGLGPDSVMLSIGAVKFNTHGISNTFYAELSLEEEIKNNYKIDAYAFKFWSAQKTAMPINGVFTREGVNKGLINFINKACFEPRSIWCNGTDFDIPIIQEGFKKSNLELPWKYNEVRDCRTVFKLFKNLVEPPPTTGDKHNALEDCKWQATYLINILNTLKIYSSGFACAELIKDW